MDEMSLETQRGQELSSQLNINSSKDPQAGGKHSAELGCGSQPHRCSAMQHGQ